MATFRLRHFSRPETLRAIAPDRLVAFLEPFREFLHGRGASLPEPGNLYLPDYEALVTAFMSPDRDTPKELIDSLFFVDEMATREGMDVLLDDAQSLGLGLGDRADDSPADVAVQVWLTNPHLLERKHAEQFIDKPRSFEYFQTDVPEPPRYKAPGVMVLRALEASLGGWFEKKKRGRTARVFVYEREDAVWFMVRHGEPYKREESVDGTEPSSVAFRPLRYDVLAYDPGLGELRVNAHSKSERDLYRAQFGAHLFGREDFFPKGAKYTLEPLRTDGDSCLHCLDVAGLDWVRLREVHLAYGGPHGEYDIHKANDLFAALRQRGRTLPTSARLARAVFLVKFTDARRPRSVAIRPPNAAVYTRDEDAVLAEEWLKRRGFLDADDEADAGPTDAILVGP